LREAGADLNAHIEYDLTLLHLAALNGQADVAKLLLDAGMAANARDVSGCTPLHYADGSGHDTIVALLRAHDGTE